MRIEPDERACVRHAEPDGLTCDGGDGAEVGCEHAGDDCSRRARPVSLLFGCRGVATRGRAAVVPPALSSVIQVETVPARVVFALIAALSTVAWAVVLRVAVAPRLSTLERTPKLRLLLLPQQFRHVSALVLLPGVASPHLDAAWVRSLVVGDVATAVLSISAVVALGRPGRAGIWLAWVATLVGLVDLVKNVAAAPAARVADHMGTAAFVPTMVVPLMLLLHLWALRVLSARSDAATEARL